MLRLGIIGAGIMGERMLRAALEHAADIAQISGVWDAAPAALDRIGSALPATARAGSASEVINGADCVYVATPPSSHLDYAGQALAAGKAVFLEKPLSVDVQAAEAFARRHGADRVAINFPFASSFAVQRLREWIEAGAVAAPRDFQIEVGFAKWPRPWQEGAASWLAGPAEGGFTREVVSHFLFLTRRLLGPLRLGSRRVEHQGQGTERLVEARLDAAGVQGRLRGAVGETDRDDTNSWTLRGTGSIRLRDWSIAERQRPDGTWVPDPDAMANEKARPLVLRRQLEQVARMTEGQPHRLARLDEALEVQIIVESILRAE
jgi:predicted dehydrogenase